MSASCFYLPSLSSQAKLRWKPSNESNLGDSSDMESSGECLLCLVWYIVVVVRVYLSDLNYYARPVIVQEV